MILAAYKASNGAEIYLPRTGRVLLPAGTIIREGDEFRTLEKDSLLVRNSEWDNLTQSREHIEELVEASKI